MASFEIDVGYGTTGSGYPLKQVLFVWDWDRRSWVNAKDAKNLGLIEGKVDWNRVSSKKMFGTLRGKAPIGTLFYYYEYFRKGSPKITFYVLTEKGLKEVPYSTVKEEIADIEGNKIIRVYRVIPDLGLKTFAYAYVKGWIQNKAQIEPVFSEDDIGKLRDRLKKALEETKRIEAIPYVSLPGFILRGDTYRIKDKLKKLGLKYDGLSWVYRIKREKIDEVDKVLEELKKLGVETERVERIVNELKRSVVRDLVFKEVDKFFEKELEERVNKRIDKVLKEQLPPDVPKPSRVKYDLEEKRLSIKFPYISDYSKFVKMRRKMRTKGFEYSSGMFHKKVEIDIKGIKEEILRDKELVKLLLKGGKLDREGRERVKKYQNKIEEWRRTIEGVSRG